jgi:Flp pilus assembly protein TadG
MVFRRFLRDQDGNVLPIFAIAMLPIFGFMGATIDFQRASSAKVQMQSALDATALILARDTAALTDGTLQTKALAFFQAQFNKPEAQDLQVTAAYQATGGTGLTLTSSATMPAKFMKLIGTSGMRFSATSIVKWGNTRLRVALVLDNTGSMSDAGKMTALKTAAKNLLTQLQNAASQNGDVYVSIIPFSKDVNVGKSNVSASWLRWDQWTHGMSCWGSWCWTGSAWLNTSDHSSWNGCVTDRDQDYDTTADAPTNVATNFPTEQYAYCPVELMPLTYDWTALNQRLNDMTPNGNTNQTIGLQWGFQSLKTNSPLTVPAKDADYQYQEVVILLTDGLNTENRWSTSQSAVDARTQKACTNIKAAGITLYAVHVNTGGDPASTMLQQCASDLNKFFLLTNANQIVTTFDKIGTSITKLRIAG